MATLPPSPRSGPEQGHACRHPRVGVCWAPTHPHGSGDDREARVQLHLSHSAPGAPRVAKLSPHPLDSFTCHTWRGQEQTAGRRSAILGAGVGSVLLPGSVPGGLAHPRTSPSAHTAPCQATQAPSRPLRPAEGARATAAGPAGGPTPCRTTAVSPLTARPVSAPLGCSVPHPHPASTVPTPPPSSAAAVVSLRLPWACLSGRLPLPSLPPHPLNLAVSAAPGQATAGRGPQRGCRSASGQGHACSCPRRPGT